jgi:hypothetical protein
VKGASRPSNGHAMDSFACLVSAEFSPCVAELSAVKRKASSAHVLRCVQMIITSPLSKAANWQEMKSGRELEGRRDYLSDGSKYFRLSW